MFNTTLLTHLIEVRRSGRLIENLPAAAQPSTLDEAYGTADALAAAFGQSAVGWKIGASTPQAWQRLGLNEPFAGRVLNGTLWDNGAAAPALLSTLTIGAEFSFRISRDLGRQELFDERSVATVVDGVYPSLEVNQVSYADPMGVGGLCIVADNGFNAGLVLGERRLVWDIQELIQLPVTFYLDGVEKSQGNAAAIQFHPLVALAWLANDRARRGDPLRAGQVVATGDLVGAIEAGHGSQVKADFGPLGGVEMTVVSGRKR